MHVGVFEDEFCGGGAERFVESQTAAVEEDLVDIGTSDTTVDAAEAFVADDDVDAVEHTAVFFHSHVGGLEFALQLEPDFDGFEGVGCCYGAAGGNAAGDEGAGRCGH